MTAAVALLSLITNAPLPAAAAEPPATILVFDGSGSMWGRLPREREAKLNIARDAVNKALLKLPAQTRVGLASFGHRRKADCSDTEIMLAPEPLQEDRLKGLLEELNPRGKGPLVLALKEAAASLAKTSGPASLILIHDDPDNCAQDPCAAAEEMAKANPRLAIHVVSIGLSKSDTQRMACVPKATGGRYFDAQTVAELDAAVDEAFRLASGDRAMPATKVAATAPVPTAPAPTVPAATDDDGPPRLKLSATLGAGGPAVIVPLAWRVTRTGAGSGALPLATGRSLQLDLPLPAGSYAVEVQQGLVRANDTVEVKAKGTTRHTVALPAGAVRLSAQLQKGSPPLDQAMFTVSEAGAGGAGRPVWSGGADAPPVFLPVGTWRIRADLDHVQTERDVTVTAGALIDTSLILGAGRLKLKVIDKEGGTSPAQVVYRITEDDSDSATGRREVARSTALEPEFTLPAGTYYVSARHGAAEARDRVLVNAGDNVARTLVLNMGKLAVQSRFAGASSPLQSNVVYRIERLDAAQDAMRLSLPVARLELPAGRYKVESSLGNQNARVAREIDVKPGTVTNLSFEHLAATVQLRINGRAPVPGEVSWTIRDGQDRNLWQSQQAEPRAFLMPGRYRILAELRDRRGVAEIDVKSGEMRVIEIQLE